MAEKDNQVGQVTGLAWTEVGGELLTIETVALPGKGKTMTTGKLGEVMQESIQAALLGGPQARSQHSLGISEDFYQKNDIHIPPSRRRHAQGRARVPALRSSTALVSVADRHSGARRCCDDRRDHAAWRGAADRRTEGEAAGRRARRAFNTALIPEENVKDLRGDRRTTSRTSWRSFRSSGSTRYWNWRWNACRSRCPRRRRNRRSRWLPAIPGMPRPPAW
jgi:ATP-dependent Lon protease